MHADSTDWTHWVINLKKNKKLGVIVSTPLMPGESKWISVISRLDRVPGQPEYVERLFPNKQTDRRKQKLVGNMLLGFLEQS